MTAVALSRRKRDGAELTAEEIKWFVTNFSSDAIGDEQMAALAMAIYFRGLSPGELAAWCTAMINTGERLQLGAQPRPLADKHSTGGIGDKITLPLVPLAAACGLAVPQLSGRGLGITGGTLDKLEAIPGWRANLSNAELAAQLRDIGGVICAAGSGLVPADRKLYALRDVTATIESIPLIASSIMSKKIAEGTQSLVLDVKVGSGAFMKSPAAATELAQIMVQLGAQAGVQTRALLTDMSVPLGRAVGNSVEVAESVEVLAGGGPSDVVELTLALAREMLELSGLAEVDPSQVLASGKAMDVWRAMITAQGGDPDAALPQPKHAEQLRAPASGYLTTLDAYAVGLAAWRLGAGRARKEDSVQAAAGITLHRQLGEAVTAGEPIFSLHTDEPGRLPPALEALTAGIEVQDLAPPPRKLILGRVS